MRKSDALLYRSRIETAVQSLGDAMAEDVRTLYPTFDELVKRGFMAKDEGYKFRYGDTLYKTAQPNISFVAHYPPGVGTESMFTRIDETHDGTLDDPTPYSGNMELEQGKYYMQDGVIYYCKYGSGIPVYEHLSTLTTFVEIVE